MATKIAVISAHPKNNPPEQGAPESQSPYFFLRVCNLVIKISVLARRLDVILATQ